MTNISKRPLAKQQEEKLFVQLSKFLILGSTIQTQRVLTDLLGYEERVMLAKRLAAIIMLVQGQSLYRIAQTLHVSSATVRTLASRLEAGEFASITKMLVKEKHPFLHLHDAIDSILHLGGLLPHYSGLDRYRSL
jgi:uncharacterized protein YerC